MAELNDSPLSAKFEVPAAREGSVKNNESEIVLLRRALKTTNNDLQVRVPLRSENYVPGVSGWSFNLAGDAELNSAFIRGTLVAADGLFSGNLQAAGGTFTGNLSAAGGTFAGNLQAAGGTFSGTLSAGTINAINITASQITSGTLDPVRIPNLSASIITSGTFDPVRIPNLAASIITSGTFDPVRIPNLSADKITTGTLNANNVTISGTLSAVTLSGVGGTFSGDLSASITAANAVRSGRFLSPSGLGTQLLSGVPAQDLPSGTVRVWGSQNLELISGTGNVTLGLASPSATAEISANSRIFYRSNPTVSGLTANVHMGDTTGLLRRITSSIRYKKDVRDAAKLPNLLDLRTVYFKAKYPLEGEDNPNREHYGVIAEEVDALGLSDLVVYNEKNQPESVAFSHFGIALIPYVKDLEERVSALENANG